ncbi:MAG: chromosome partitioning protein [Gammaproteobacteria bacterium CG22_combo_CG10-13_8_21_14_all_40_8]|nr:MAG: chromosome partitioning protein [Gammaproteobacteria bacterium CG22_combo_CG10-13_8_21_14_all_40_8]
MARIIAVTNQKGGVGKTTTSINLAASLAATGRRVLLLDMDPQGNTTMGSGVDKNDLEFSVFDVLVGSAAIKEVMVNAEQSGYYIVPANGDLTAAEVHLLSMENKEHRLKNALTLAKNEFDYIFIDCPPSLNMLSVNAMVAADSLIIPMQCEYFALEGLSALLSTIDQITESHNPNLQIEGLVRTMYDPRNRLCTEVSAQLQEHFGDKVYRTPIPRNVRIAEAPSYGLPAMYYDKTSRGSRAYMALAEEVIKTELAREPA